MKSMTGYASKAFSISDQKFNLEIKSYNHKYLDIFFKAPRSLNYMENRLKKEVSKVIERGKVEIFLTLVDASIDDIFEEKKAVQLYNFLSELNKKFGNNKKPSLMEVVFFRDFFIHPKDDFVIDKFFENELIKHFSDCLNKFSESRVMEGNFLRKDVQKRLKILSSHVSKVEKYLPKVKERQKAKIKKRIEEFLVKEVQKERLEQEISYMLDKFDVNEEIVRLKQHIANFEKIMEEKGSCGKKLDFYTQEMLREINTLSVKSQDGKVSEISVEIKAEIEKIREQVQNVE